MQHEGHILHVQVPLQPEQNWPNSIRSLAIDLVYQLSFSAVTNLANLISLYKTR